MDMSEDWLSDLVMEDGRDIMDQWQMLMSLPHEVNGDGFDKMSSCFDPIKITTSSTAGINLIQLNSNMNDDKNYNKGSRSGSGSGWSSCTSSSPISGQLISFGSWEYDDAMNDNITGNNVRSIKKEAVNYVVGDDDDDDSIIIRKKSNPIRQQKRLREVSLCSQEHVLAERIRREKMTLRFNALSALIPDLKKMDKASILGDAAKYLKQLEEQVKQLEEQTSKRIVESVVLVNKTQESNIDDDSSSSDDNSINSLLEIEARTSNKNVLIRIHSQKQVHGLLPKVLNEIEKLHLTTLNSNTMSFGGYAMDITIISQMNDDFCLPMKDLVMHLRMTLHQFLICLQK